MRERKSNFQKIILQRKGKRELKRITKSTRDERDKKCIETKKRITAKEIVELTKITNRNRKREKKDRHKKRKRYKKGEGINKDTKQGKRKGEGERDRERHTKGKRGI